jgi:hypothetical protein
MAKMFYTLDEVCSRLGKGQDEVEAMVAAGEIQEFRDGEALVFKVEQIDLLATSDDSGVDIELNLSDSALDLGDSGPIDLSGSDLSSGSSEVSLGDDRFDPPTPLPDKAPAAISEDDVPAAAPAEDSAADDDVSIDDLALHLEGSSLESFDLGGSDSGEMNLTEPGGLADELDLSAELAAPSEPEDSGDISGLELGEAGETRLGQDLDDLTLESVGSGSGLLDLTRESDDTSLGAELLEEVYSSDDDFVDVPAASGLFEAADASGGAESIGGAAEPTAAVAAAPAAMAAQAWDPAGSGLTMGMSIGALVCLLGVFAIVGVEIVGGASGLAPLIGDDLWMWTGGIAGGTVLLGLIGLLIGKRG